MQTVVDDKTEALVELLLASDLGGRDQEVAENLLVALLRLGELRETVARLGDEDDVHGALRRDVAERQHLVVLEDNLGRDVLGDDLVEDGRLAGLRVLLGVERRGSTRRVLLVRHGVPLLQLCVQHGQAARQRREAGAAHTGAERERRRERNEKLARRSPVLGFAAARQGIQERCEGASGLLPCAPGPAARATAVALCTSAVVPFTSAAWAPDSTSFKRMLWDLAPQSGHELRTTATFLYSSLFFWETRLEI